MPIYTEIQLYRIHKTVLVWAAGQVFLRLLPSRILATQRPGLELGRQRSRRPRSQQEEAQHQCFMEVKKVERGCVCANGGPRTRSSRQASIWGCEHRHPLQASWRGQDGKQA